MANVTWNGGSGVWDTATLWSTGTIPGAADAVTIDAGGSYTVTLNGTADAAASILLNAAAATLLIQGTLGLGGTLATEAGTLELAGGAIDGGTLALQSGGTLVAGGGTLDGVTVLGPLALTGPGQSFTVAGGIDLLGAGGTLPGTLALLGGGDTVAFADAETLNNLVINLGTVGGFFQVGSTLTLGAAATMTASGTAAFVDFDNPAGNPATLVNAGSIALTGTPETLEINLSSFVNSGSIGIGAGDVLEISHFVSTPGTFSNTGTINFAAGGKLIIGDSVSPADLAGITLNGGTLFLEGAYENTGQTLTATATGLFSNVLLASGTILGGTITPAGGSFVSGDGTFDGVTWNSTLLAPGGALVLLDGLTLAAGNDTLDLSGGGAVLARDAETLDNILIPLGNGADLGTSGTGELTLGVHALATLGTGGTASIGGGTVSNAGTIQVSGGLLSITASAFSDPGTIETSGGTVDFAGSVTAASFGNVINTGGTVEIGGTFVNTGTTLILPGTGTFSNILLSGTLEGGTVQPAGGSIGFVRLAVLAGVTYDGPLDLSAQQAYVDISGGITLTGTNGTGAGAVLLTGGDAELEVSTTTTLDNATITAGNAQSSTADVFVGDQISIDNELVLGPNLVLIDQGPAAIGTLLGADLLIEGSTLTNAGTMEALAVGGTLDIATFVFANSGTISLAAGAVLEFQGDLTTANLGSIENAGGTVDFSGDLTNTGATLDIAEGGALSTVLFGSGGDVIGGTIIVNGGTAQFAGGSELDGVTFDGAMELSSPASFVQITGGITLHGSGGSGAGSIDLTGAGGNLSVVDSETLDAATVEIGNAATADGLTIEDGGTLTFGAGLLVQETGTGALGVIGGFGTIVNDGTIRAAGVGGGLTIDPVEGFTNQGSLEIGAGGLLAVNFGGGNAAAIGSLTNSGGTLEILGTLNNTGSLLDITAGSPFAGALLDGELTGGTVAMDGGTLEYAGTSLGSGGGTLSAITVKGALDLSTALATLLLENGVSLVANGATAASVNLTGAGASLAMADNETLDNAAFAIGNAATGDALNTNGTLTLGTGLQLTESAAGARAVISGVALVNEGTIAADAAGGELALSVSSFVNTGLLSIGAGGLLSVNVNGALANLGSIVNAGGTLGLTGTIGNAGSTLVIGSSGAFSDVLLNGTIDGGTVELDGGVLQFGSLAAFNGVTFIGPTIDLGGSGAGLWVHAGTTLSSGGASPMVILVSGQPTKFLTFDGGVTLSDTDILVSGTADQLDVGLIAPGTVTFAANTSIDIGGNSRVILGSDMNSAALTTAGTIHVANAGTLSIAGPALLDSGTIAVDAGAVLQVIDSTLPASGWIGSVVGTGATLQVASASLDLGGGTLSISPTLAFAALQNFGFIGDGTIINDGSYSANVSVLQNISFDGVLDLSAPGQREIEEDGLSLHGLDGTSPGTVVLTGAGSQLQFQDSTTLDHATVTLAGGPGLAGGTTEPTAITFVNDLTFGSGLTINATESGATSEIFGDGDLTSAATINVGSGASLLINPITFGATSFTDTGPINLAAGGTLAVEAVTTTGNLGDIANSGGTLLLGGTMNNAGATISDAPGGVFSNLVLGGPGPLQLNGGSVANAGGSLSFAAVVTLNGVQFSGPLHVGNSAIVTFTNTSTLAPGAVSIDGGAVLTLPTLIAGQSVGVASGEFIDAGGGNASGSFAFDGNATLGLQSPLAFLTPITAFGPDRTIDLPDSTVTNLMYSGSTLSVLDGTNTIATLLVGTGYHPGDFSFTGDGALGTDLTTTSFACFATGTGILTAQGEVAVQALSVGDRVVALHGTRLARVRWIGHRGVDLRGHPRPCDVNPVRIRAHAFGAGRPHTDLLLSPDHAVYWRDALVPVRHLINGVTVTQETAESIMYWHVELDRHEALMASGLAAESYLDTGNRGAFENEACAGVENGRSDHHRRQGG